MCLPLTTTGRPTTARYMGCFLFTVWFVFTAFRPSTEFGKRDPMTYHGRDCSHHMNRMEAFTEVSLPSNVVDYRHLIVHAHFCLSTNQSPTGLTSLTRSPPSSGVGLLYGARHGRWPACRRVRLDAGGTAVPG